MYIRVTTLDGRIVENIPTDAINLQKTIEKVKEKYPKEKFHADLITY